jgi:hypothetical protein
MMKRFSGNVEEILESTTGSRKQKGEKNKEEAFIRCRV